MLLSRRVSRFPELGVALETHAVLHRHYRIHAVRNHGVTIDDRLVLPAFARKGHLGRSVLTVVLAGVGSLCFGSGERHLRAGDVSLLPGKSAVAMRQSDDYESLVLEWDPGWLGGEVEAFEQGRLSPAALESARQLARALMTASAAEALSERVARELGVLGAEGLPLVRRDENELRESIEPLTARLSAELDRLLSCPGSVPMVVDLERSLGLSSRHLSRKVADFHALYGFNAEGWVDARNRRRLMAGAALMTAAGATTERVARLVGYSSPTAFCRAMAEVGLPQPGQMARAVGALGEDVRFRKARP